jgi:gliding motility-associated-like protein
MKRVLYICIFLSFIKAHSQQLFYQNNFRGGVCGDGISYNGLNYLVADSIHFFNTLPTGSIIKKAFLISHKLIVHIGAYPLKEPSISFLFNNNIVSFDSTDNITPPFYCDLFHNPSGKSWMVAKDVTSITQSSNNVLITSDQDVTNEYVYCGFYLVILYENTAMPATNAAIFINNQTYNSNMLHSLSGMNSMNNTNDIGMAIWCESTADPFPLMFELSSSLGTFTLGTLRDRGIAGFPSDMLAGSFVYENNILTGLADDTPDPYIDSTDALANIKTYVTNNAQNFNMISHGTATDNCVNMINSFFIAYTTPCPAHGFTDTLTTHTICEGQGITLGTQSTGNNYSWYPSNSLNNASSATPIASPTTTTNYIVSIDSMGCKHTEQVRVNVYPAPVADTITTGNNFCGGPTGNITVDPPSGIYNPYTYSFNNGPFVSDTAFTGLAAGSYTITIKDSNGCTWQNSYPLIIKDTLGAHAYISASPSTGTAPLGVTVSAFGTTGVNTYNWYVNGSQVSTNNFLTYTFPDSGNYQVTLIAYNTIASCADTASVTVFVLPADTSGIFIPNVFSPNADGINDVWEVQLKNAGINSLEIFDRWGLAVFQKEKQSFSKEQVVEWDGRTTAGMACSEGTYFYVISYTVLNKSNQKEERKAQGFITLVR